MKKNHLLIILLLFSSLIGQAQRTVPSKAPEPANPQKYNLHYKGYIIRVIPADFGTYGYIISYGEKVVLHQPYNPFTPEPTGLKKKEDVFKVAKWQINEITESKITAKSPPAINRNSNNSPKLSTRLPITLAKELQIDVITQRKPQ